MSNLNFISDVIYSLKKEYGQTIDLYRYTDSQVDDETGIKTINKEKYTIKQAILLPRQIILETLKLIGVSSQFSYNNNINKSNRIIIIDKKDYPNNFVLKIKDYIIYNLERYNIVEVPEFFDENLAVVLKVEKVEGEELNLILENTIKTKINITHHAEGTL